MVWIRKKRIMNLRNCYVNEESPLQSRVDLATGLWRSSCEQCHNQGLKGGNLAPDLKWKLNQSRCRTKLQKQAFIVPENL